MGKSKHVYSILIDGDISGLEKSMKSAVKTVASSYDKMAKAADKVKHLKDVVGYISQVDNALDVLYHKNPDAFLAAFSNLDDGLKNVMQNLFNIEKHGLETLNELGTKINSLDGTEGVKSMRKMAEDLNSLYEIIGKAPPINMGDGLFEGKGGKDVIQKRIAILKTAYEQFALVWKDVDNQIGKGLGFGGIGGGAHKGGGKTIVDELKVVKKMVQDINNFEPIDLGFDSTVEEAQRLMEKFAELNKKHNEMIANDDVESETYARNYAELAKTAAQLIQMQDELSTKGIAPVFMRDLDGMDDVMEDYMNDVDYLISDMSQLLEGSAQIADFVGQVAEEFGAEIPAQTDKAKVALEELDTVLRNVNDAIFSTDIGDEFELGKFSSKLETLRDELHELAKDGQISMDQFNLALESISTANVDIKNKLESDREKTSDVRQEESSRLATLESELEAARNDAEMAQYDRDAYMGAYDEVSGENFELKKENQRLLEENLELNKEIATLTKMTSAYKALDDANDAYENAATPKAEERAEGAIEAAKDELSEFVQEYHSVVATMQDGSVIKIKMDDDDASEALQNLLQMSKQIQGIDFVPRSAGQSIESYEKLDALLLNIGKRNGDTDGTKPIGSFSADVLSDYINKLKQCVSIVDAYDPEFIYGNKEQYEQAVQMLSNLEEQLRRLSVLNAFDESDIFQGIFDDQWTDQIENAFLDVRKSIADGVIVTAEEAISKFEELGVASNSVKQDLFEGATGQLGFFDNLSEDVQQAETHIESLNNEVKELDGQLSLFDTKESDIPTAFEEEVSTVANVTQLENSDLAALAEQVTVVEAAIRSKTAAFEEEGTTVSSVVQKEIEELTQLLSVLQQITGQVTIASAGLDKMSNDTPKKDDKPAPDESKKKVKDKDYYINDFATYRAEIESAGYVTDELREKMNSLDGELQNVSTPDGLNHWIESLNEFKQIVAKAKQDYVALEETKIKQIRGEVNSGALLKGLDFNVATSNLSAEQSEIISLREKLLSQLSEYENKVRSGEKAELDGINATKQALLDKVKAYKQQHNYIDASGKSGDKYTASKFKTMTGRMNAAQEIANSQEFKNSAQVAVKLQEVTTAYNNLADARKRFSSLDSLTGDQEIEYDMLVKKANEAVTAFNRLISSSQKLKSKKANVEDYTLGADFVDNLHNRKAALDDFVKSVYPLSAGITQFKNNYTEAMFVIDNGDGTITNMTARFDDARTEIVALANSTMHVMKPFEAFTVGLADKLKTLSTYFTASEIIQRTWQAFKNGVQSVKDIDSALTELKKVTDETDSTYNAFLQDMSKTASVVGSTVRDLTSSAADWGRLGYSLKDAGELAATTAKLLNVSEFSSVEDATSALVSTLQAFTTAGQDVGQRAEEIVDILNNIGNKYPVATNELAEGLASSGAALVAANNSIEEQVALLSAGNATMQDVSTVAAGLKIVAARLRGTTTDIDDDADSAVTNVSKLQSKIKALTKEANGGEGIDILNEKGEYKSTYEILNEISKVFDKMDDVSQASLLELIAGKNRSSVVAAILQNGNILESAYADALNSEGSAQKELDTYLDSIQGRIDLFNNAVQTMWMNLISSDVIKGIVDIGTTLIKFLDTGIGKITVLMGLVKGLGLYGESVVNKQDFLFEFLPSRLENVKDKVKNLDVIKNILDPARSGYASVFSDVFDGYAEGLAYQILNPYQAADAIQNFVKQFKQITAKDLFGQLEKSGVDKGAFEQIYQDMGLDVDQLANTVLHPEQVNKIMSSLQKEFKKIKPVDLLTEIVNTTGGDTSSFDSLYEALGITSDNWTKNVLDPDIIKQTLESVEGLDEAQIAAIMSSDIFAASQTVAAGATDIFSAAIIRAKAVLIAFKDALMAAWVNNPVLLTIAAVALAVGAIAAAYKAWGPTHENALKKLNQETEELKAVQDELSSVDSELKSVQDSIDELQSKDKLTFTEEQELERLKAINAELEREQKILKAKEYRERQDQVKAAVDAARKDLDLNGGVNSPVYDTIYNNTDLVDHSAISAFESKLIQLERAKSELVEAEEALANADPDSKYQYNKLTKNVEAAKKKVDELNSSIDSMSNDWLSNYGDVGYIEAEDDRELTQLEKTWNDYYRQYQNYMNRQLLLNGDISESQALDYLFGRTASDDAKAFIKEINNAFNNVDISSAKEELDTATQELHKLRAEAAELDVDLNKTQFGNIDTNDTNRILDWTDANIEAYREALKSWNINADELAGSYSTVLGTFDTFSDGVGGSIDIAFSPMLQTDNGPQILDSNTVNTYINKLIKAATVDGEFDADKLISLDAQGIEIEGKLIKGILADVGATAEKTSQQMHFAGSTGAIATTVEWVQNAKETYDELSNSFGTILETILAKYPSLKKVMDSIGIDSDSLVGFFKNSAAEANAAANIVKTKTYSALNDSLTNYNEIQKQTHEILTNGTTVTQEYKDALIDLVGSEEKVNECFVDGNSLVIKNADGLDDLLKISKKNISSQAKLAKTQAMLKYRELYKELAQLTNGRKVEDAAVRQQIESIRYEMNALQGSIAQYAILEHKLLGTANAYERLAEAQEIDAANDYGSKAEELATVLSEAFKTGELGTEAAKVAISGLIPDDLLDKSKTLDEQMKQIETYFTKGEVSKLFKIKYDDDGGIESVEMTRDKLVSYMDELGKRTLTDSSGNSLGTIINGNFDEYTLNPAITSLKEFADACNLSEEVAFAFLSELERYDISHLGVDSVSILDQLMGDDFEYQSHKITTEMANLEHQVASGQIGVEEYQEAIGGLNWKLAAGKIDQETYNTTIADLKTQLDNGTISMQQYIKAVEGMSGVQNYNNKQIKDNALAWVEASNHVDQARVNVENITSELEEMKNSGASEQEIQVKTDALKFASSELSEALKKKYSLEEPTEMTLQIAFEQAEQEIEQFKAENSVLLTKVEIKVDEDGKHTYTIKPDVKLESSEKSALDSYIGMLNDQYTINVLADGNPNDSTAEIQAVTTAAEAAAQAIQNIPDPNINTQPAINAINSLQSEINAIKGKTVDIYETTHKKTVYSWGVGEANGTVNVNGTAHVNGTAYKNGSWGAKNTETALVGELGPELVVRDNKWFTVGDNGAEFTNIQKGDIIFNHKQTKQLLKNGYVTGRGRLAGGNSAFASGTAYAYTIGATSKEDKQLKDALRDVARAASTSVAAATQTINKLLGVSSTTTSKPKKTNPSSGGGGNSYNGTGSSGSGGGGGGGGGSSDSAEEFEEVFDWVEVRIEEINEELELLAAKLENAVGYKEQNSFIDQMIDTNKKLLENLDSGAAEYKRYAEKLLQEVPEAYRAKAQEGAIEIQEFTDKADEKTIEAIEKYREYTQKYADLIQQAEEIETEIANLAKQKFDNASAQYENEISIIERVNEQLEAQVSLMEDRGYVAATEYYETMMANTKNHSAQLEEEKRVLQGILDEQVKLGNIKEYSDEWYEMVDAIYEVDASIDDCTASLEEYQNAINDIYWDNFEDLIDRFDYLSNETQNIIDLMGDIEEVVSTPELEDGWSADDVKWTKEGLVSLGLYAQQMEIAEKKAQEYSKAIDDLNNDYVAGKYSENEYLEKLNELKDAQYDSIEAYYDAQEAIKDLNQARVDEIKNGIDKQIEAYEKLIDKKKEALESEKDLYDFQKGVMNQQKDIADVERKLAALAADNSASARAQRAKLEAELAELKSELQDTYYDRSITKQQEALDKELETFQEVKDEEVTKWEEYLDNIEQVVADSLGVVQANAQDIGATLTDKAQEYNLTLSEAIMSPWRDGALAISDYQDKFDTAASSTTNQLEQIKLKWQEIIGKMSDAAVIEMNQQQQENSKISNTRTSTYEPAANASTSDYDTYVVKTGDTLWNIAADKLGDGNRWREIYLLNSDIIDDANLIYPGQQFKIPKYANGTIGVKKSGASIIDELGEELVLRAHNGRLTYLEKGSGVIPADLTENLMEWGKLDPSDMLDRNKPSIGIHPEVHNNEIIIDNSIAELIHIDNCSTETLPDVEKIVNKALEKHTQKLNQSLRKYVR